MLYGSCMDNYSSRRTNIHLGSKQKLIVTVTNEGESTTIEIEMEIQTKPHRTG